MEPDVAGVLSQFRSIKKHASLLYPGNHPQEEIGCVVEEFNDAKAHFERIRYEQKISTYLRDIEIEYERYKQKALLRVLDIECDKAIGVLESIATPLSKDELDKLSSLREELEKLSEVLPDINYGRNLEEAIDEYEKGDFLTSALISSRVIIYAVVYNSKSNIGRDIGGGKFL